MTGDFYVFLYEDLFMHAWIKISQKSHLNKENGRKWILAMIFSAKQFVSARQKNYLCNSKPKTFYAKL